MSASSWVGYQKDKFKVYINGVADSSTAKAIGSVAAGAGLASGVNGLISLAIPFIPQATFVTAIHYSIVGVTFLVGTIMTSAEIDLSITSIKDLKKEVAQLKKVTLTQASQIKYLKQKLVAYERAFSILATDSSLTEDQRKELHILEEELKKIVLRSDSIKEQLEEQRLKINVKHPQAVEMEIFKNYDEKFETSSTTKSSNSGFFSLNKSILSEEKKNENIVPLTPVSP